jgi:signal transduction histidine kinase
MLSLSKFDNAEGKLPKEPVNLAEVIENVLFTLKPTLESAQITTNFHHTGEPLVRGDLGQLSQVFINLITNAVKFSEPQSQISIALTSNVVSQRVEVIITDHGIGIPPEDIPRIFTRFFRAKNVDSARYQGSGLGLSIVEKAITHHGGTISVDSQLGAGTTFQISLPLYQEETFNG